MRLYSNVIILNWSKTEFLCVLIPMWMADNYQSTSLSCWQPWLIWIIFINWSPKWFFFLSWYVLLLIILLPQSNSIANFCVVDSAMIIIVKSTVQCMQIKQLVCCVDLIAFYSQDSTVPWMKYKRKSVTDYQIVYFVCFTVFEIEVKFCIWRIKLNDNNSCMFICYSNSLKNCTFSRFSEIAVDSKR